MVSEQKDLFNATISGIIVSTEKKMIGDRQLMEINVRSQYSTGVLWHLSLWCKNALLHTNLVAGNKILFSGDVDVKSYRKNDSWNTCYDVSNPHVMYIGVADIQAPETPVPVVSKVATPLTPAMPKKVANYDFSDLPENDYYL